MHSRRRTAFVCLALTTATSAAIAERAMGQSQPPMLLQNGSTSFRTLGFLNNSGGGRFETEALGVSPDGQSVVGYSFDSIGQRTAFSWNLSNLNNLNAPLTSLGNLGGLNGVGNTDSVANGVANDGFAVGSSVSQNSQPSSAEAFRVATSGQTPGAALPGYSQSIFNSTAFGISAQPIGASGSGPYQYETVVGQARFSNTVNQRVATTWRVDRTNGDAVSGPFNLQNFASGPQEGGSTGFQTAARAVTTDGSVAVGFGLDTVNGSSVARQAYWKLDPTTGQPTGPAVPLPFLPNTSGFAQDGEARGVGLDGTAASGFVAVGRSQQLAPNNGQAAEATVWSVDGSGNVTTKELGWLGPQGIGGPFSSIANAISAQTARAQGQPTLKTIVGTSSSSDPLTSSAFREAFVAYLDDPTRPTMLSLKNLLNNTEYHLQIPDTFKMLEATAISADGNVIVGYGTNQLNQTEGWVVVMATPEPGSFATLGLCAAFALRRRRTARK